jgi:flavin-dependent dehydrogenase
VRGAPLRCALTGARPWSGGAVVATGEAIGATYPLTGEGIGKAMETAERCAAAVCAALDAGALEPLAAYPARLTEELLPRYGGYAVAERWIGQAWLADLVMRRAARRPRVRAALTGILTETVRPESVFSPFGALRTLLA